MNTGPLPSFAPDKYDLTLNHLEKAERVKEVRERLSSDQKLMENVIGGYDANPEKIAEHRRWNEEKLAWFLANPGDGQTPERIASAVRCCRDELVTLTDLHRALSWVEEIENNSMELQAKSPTRTAMESRIYREERDAARWLERCVTVAEVAFLSELAARSWRRRARFRMQRERWLGCRGGMMMLIDLKPRLSVVGAGFECALARVATLVEVKRLLGIFQTEARVVTEDGERVVVGEGFKIFRVS